MRASAIAFVTLAVLFTALTSFFAFSPLHAGSASFWLLAGGPAVVFGALALVLARREDLLGAWLSPRWGDFTRGILGAALLFAAAWAFARLICPRGSAREIWLVSLYGQIGDPRRLQAYGPAVGLMLALLVLAEELVWRGMVTVLLAERFGSTRAWVWAAFLYAAAYLPTLWALGSVAGPNPVLVLAALGGGLVWGAMGRYFGTLVPGFIAHALFDWAVVMMFPLWAGPVWG